MKHVFWTVLMISALSVPGCSDDEGDDPPKNDSGVSVSDTSIKKDRSWSTLDDKGVVVHDLPINPLGDLSTTIADQNIPVGDLPQGTKTCSEVFSCAKQCTDSDLTCLPACLASGCGSATDTVIQDFYSCAMGTCSSDCLSSFSSDCEACLNSNCTTALAACLSHSC